VATLEIDERIAAIEASMGNLEQVFDVASTEAEISQLEAQASAPDLWDDQANAQRVTSRLSFLQGELRRMQELKTRVADLPIMFELAEAEDDDAAQGEAIAELDALEKDLSDLEVRTLLSGEYDDREALVTIRSEAGGVDAADWAEMLLRMYTRYCERHKWPVEVYDTSYAEEAGIKSATFAVKAPYAYGTLSIEQGTHRLVRISPFDNQGRRQTSFAGVEVIPVVEQTESIVRSCRTRQRRWESCRPNCSSAAVRRSRPRSMRSRGIRQGPGGIKCARTCSIRIKWSRICVRSTKPATPRRFWTVRSTISSLRASDGAGNRRPRPDRCWLGQCLDCEMPPAP